MYESFVCLIVCVFIQSVPGAEGGQKKMSDPLNCSYGCCEPRCGCWKGNLGPLQKQQILLFAAPSLQPYQSVPHLRFPESTGGLDGLWPQPQWVRGVVWVSISFLLKRPCPTFSSMVLVTVQSWHIPPWTCTVVSLGLYSYVFCELRL